MSAYKLCQCDLRNKEMLLAALKTLGLEPTVYATPQHLKGYQGDTRDVSAEIVVERSKLNARFTQASNDLGFKWNHETKQFDVVISDYDQSSGMLARVQQAYLYVVIAKAMEEARFSESEGASENRLQARKRADVRLAYSQWIGDPAKQVTVDVTLTKEGKLVAAPSGTVGDECLSLLSFLDDVDGLTVVSTTRTDDYDKGVQIAGMVEH